MEMTDFMILACVVLLRAAGCDRPTDTFVIAKTGHLHNKLCWRVVMSLLTSVCFCL